MERTTEPKTTRCHRSNVPMLPGALPLLGHSLRLLRDPVTFLGEARACGALVEFRLGRRRSYLVCSPDLVHKMLVTDVHIFEKGGPLFEAARLLLGNALILSHGEEHRRQRRIMQPVFHPDRIRSYVDFMTEESAALVRSWNAGEEIDVNREMNKFTARVATRTVLSMDADHETVSELGRLFELVLTGLFYRMAAPAFVSHVPIGGNRRFNRALVELKSLVDRLIAEARATGQRAGEGTGLLGALLGARDEETGESLTDEEIRNQVLNLLIAGTETSATTLAWTLYALAANPRVESLVHREVDEVLGGRPVRSEDLSRLSYTRDVIYESLRVYPPVWMLSRRAKVDVTLAGSEFSEGTHFYFSQYLLHHDPGSFPDPERFDPDRWNSEPAQAIPRGAWMPFGMGKHKCIGDMLGMSQVMVMTAMVTAGWRLRLVPGPSPRPRVRTTFIPYGLRMVPEPRILTFERGSRAVSRSAPAKQTSQHSQT